MEKLGGVTNSSSNASEKKRNHKGRRKCFWSNEMISGRKKNRGGESPFSKDENKGKKKKHISKKQRPSGVSYAGVSTEPQDVTRQAGESLEKKRKRGKNHPPLGERRPKS